MCNPFMTQQNYEELREHSTTNLFIPRHPQDLEPPTMAARVFSPGGKFECDLSFADGGTQHTEQEKREEEEEEEEEEEGPVATIVFRLDTSGLYRLQCEVKYYHTISRSFKARTWKKAVNVTLFKGTTHGSLRVFISACFGYKFMLQHVHNKFSICLSLTVYQTSAC